MSITHFAGHAWGELPWGRAERPVFLERPKACSTGVWHPCHGIWHPCRTLSACRSMHAHCISSPVQVAARSRTNLFNRSQYRRSYGFRCTPLAHLQIDTEGTEPWVVEGGRRFFQVARPPYVMAEHSDDMMRRATGKPASAFMLTMSELGYSVHQDSFDGPVIPSDQLAGWREPGIRDYWFVLRNGGGEVAHLAAAGEGGVLLGCYP